MSLERLINRSCTILRRIPTGEKDERGTELFDEQEVDAVCELQQLDRSENPEGVSKADSRIFFLAGTEIQAGDAVVIPGEGKFEIEGTPDRKRNPRTQQMRQVETLACRTGGDSDEESGS